MAVFAAIYTLNLTASSLTLAPQMHALTRTTAAAITLRLTLQQQQHTAHTGGVISSEDKLVGRRFCPDHVPRCTVLGCSDRAVCEAPRAVDTAATDISTAGDTTTAVIELEVRMREQFKHSLPYAHQVSACRFSCR
jgi:hypothetical protein